MSASPSESTVMVPVRLVALERAYEVLRAVAAGDPVDDAGSAAKAALALGGFPALLRDHLSLTA